jgi:hypothetical protein
VTTKEDIALVRNAADPEQVKDAGVKEKQGRDRDLDDVFWVLQSRQGRRFYLRMLTFCGVFRSSWDPSAKIHFNEGQRNVGLMMLADLNESDPSAYEKMKREEAIDIEIIKRKPRAKKESEDD